MQAVVIHKFGPASVVLKMENIEVPDIGKGEILIRQHASSVNPIDLRMRAGYGRVLFSKMRGFTFPLILGRDVSGEVVKIGADVKTLSVGDAVFGVPAPKAQGAHAEFVVARQRDVVRKPASLSFTEAAAFPYVACTVWEALVSSAGLTAENARGKKVFVQGGAGGIGSFAIQLLKAWGAYVVSTCSGRNVDSVASLGADLIIDYEREDYAEKLANFDVALETIGGPLEEKTLRILRKDGHGRFVTLVHPLLQTFDESGLLMGAAKNLCAFAKRRRHARALGVSGYSWATFKPNPTALSNVRNLAEEARIRPHIDREFALKDIVAAHRYCEQGRSSGKVILRIR